MMGVHAAKSDPMFSSLARFAKAASFDKSLVHRHVRSVCLCRRAILKRRRPQNRTRLISECSMWRRAQSALGQMNYGQD